MCSLLGNFLDHFGAECYFGVFIFLHISMLIFFCMLGSFESKWTIQLNCWWCCWKYHIDYNRNVVISTALFSLEMYIHQWDESSLVQVILHQGHYLNQCWALATKLWIEIWFNCQKMHFNGLMQERRNSIAYVTPLLTHWSYIFLALTHRFEDAVFRMTAILFSPQCLWWQLQSTWLLHFKELQGDGIYHKISNIRRTKIHKLKCFSSRLAVVFAQSNGARCWVKNEDVVGAAPTGDAPTTSEWSTILLLTKVRLILETWR